MNCQMGERGRPTKKEQLGMDGTLRVYFERGISATVTASKTGYNIKTVCKYFDEWTEQAIETQTVEYTERQKKERERAILSLDSIISELYSVLDKVDDTIAKLSPEKNSLHLLKFKHEILKTISSLVEKKGVFAMAPTLDEILEKKFDEMMETHDKTRSNN